MVERAARVLATGLRFPEGPVAMPDGSVLLVEIAAGRIRRVAPNGELSVVAEPGGGPNGLATGPDGALYCCNNGGFAWIDAEGHLRPYRCAEDYDTGRIERIDLATGEIQRVYDRCGANRLSGPNDIVFDRSGGFWFSDLGKVRARDRDHGGVYWAAADGSRIVEAAHPIAGGANGIGLSPDEQTLYVAETETGRLWAFDVLEPGLLYKDDWPSPHGGRLLCQFPGYRRLDSMAITAAGNICVATLVSGEITTVSPEGEIIDIVTLDDRMSTNLCFGGPDLRTAFITLSTTGRLVEMPWAEPGLALNFSPQVSGNQTLG
ncbi:MAG TPA: SMP-30/gluconolactonase/LRE family protein [Chthonomonadaceae bacterium]|nr:SMP-30/gluconolactonase/LRE family protein [Chthonomonadaceae bacterium]